jgi:hypothetical protein
MSVAAKSSPVHSTACPVRSASAYVKQSPKLSPAGCRPFPYRTVSQVRIDGHDVQLRVTKEPVDDVLPGRPQPSLDDDTQLDPNGGRHQPDEGILQVGRQFFAARLAEDDRYRRRRIDDKAPSRRLGQRGRPISS